MRRLAESDLLGSVARLESASGPCSNFEACLVISAGVIGNYLGDKWIDDNIRTSGSGDSDFIRFEALEGIDDYRRNSRIIELAEMLFNFQDIDGFEKLIGRLTTRKDLEAAIAELEAAELLFGSAIQFRFVDDGRETDKATSEILKYDIEACIGIRIIACEVKCNLEDTALSVGSIRSAFKKARKQLRTDIPGIFFLRIPEAWVRDPSIQDTLHEAIDGMGTGRISALVVRWNEWHSVGHECGLCVKRFATYHNKRARHPLQDLGKIIRVPLRTDLWKLIPNIIQRPLHGFQDH
jgi:hypothetical protein